LTPHLSIVAVSRNDDHGGSLLARMQHFVDALAYQCARFRLRAELLLVEWNPPVDRPPLKLAIQWPARPHPLSIRIVTVPAHIHARFEHGDRLSLFQMIGKNVGIRRARGEFILATNIDIIFGDQTIKYLRDRLCHRVLLRADRFDVPSSTPPESIEDRLLFWENRVFHVYTRFGVFDVNACRFVTSNWPFDVDGGDIAPDYGAFVDQLYCYYTKHRSLRRFISSMAHELTNAGWKRRLEMLRQYQKAIREMYFENRLTHTVACGDFTLLSQIDWTALRGYPEFNGYPWHLDSALVYAALSAGIRQIVLPPSHRVSHIAHSLGSGWTPEGAQALFARLRAANIPYLSDDDLLAWRQRLYKTPAERTLNADGWGLSDISLPEIELGEG
jgi:hypothetical protein